MANYRLGTPTTIDSLVMTGSSSFTSITVSGAATFNSQIQSADGYARIFLDNTGSGVTISNGSAGNYNKGHFVIGSSGGIDITSVAQTRISYNSGTPMIEANSTSVTLTSQDNTSASIQVGNGTGPISYVNGNARWLVQSSQVYAPVTIRSEQDGIGAIFNTSNVGLSAINNTAAINGTQQYSPTLELRGMGYNIGGAVTEADGWYIQAQPVQGTPSTVNLLFGSSINEGTPITKFSLKSDGTAIISGHASIDGYTIDISGGAITNQVLQYNGTSFVPTTPGLQDKANASDFQLTTTSATDVVSFTPTAQGNFVVYVFYRVATAITNVGINVTWTDGAGASTSVIVPATTSTAVGSYNALPVYLNSTSGTAIKVTATAGTANNLYVSATIVGIS